MRDAAPAAPRCARRQAHAPAATGYRPPAVDAPRQVAYDVLSAVRERDAYANLVLPGMLRDRRLDTRDAALATELAYGTLRGRGLYDAVLQACVDRPLTQVDPPVLDVLRLGRTSCCAPGSPRTPRCRPPSTSPAGCCRPDRSGFVNAVLRKVAARDLAGWLAELRPDDPLEAMALEHSHPRWIASAFRDALRGDLDATAAALQADDLRPEVHLVARRMPRDELLELTGGQAGPWSAHAVRLREGDPGGSHRCATGGPACRTRAASSWHWPWPRRRSRGRTRCGSTSAPAPGGKASLLQATAAERGARLLALEVQPHRARLVRGSGVELVATADARRPPLVPGSVDRVLLDAPCSGLGALRRRPEARWRRRPTDLPALTRLQGELLDAAATLLRPAASPSTRPARRTWPRRSCPCPTCCAGTPSSSRSTSARSCPGCPSWVTVPLSSSGRTCTAPTRCT
jgi:16S rRNA (cytosine967-C5)-methyltransferase